MQDDQQFSVGDRVLIVGNGHPIHHYFIVGTDAVVADKPARAVRSHPGREVFVEGLGGPHTSGVIRQWVGVGDLEPFTEPDPADEWLAVIDSWCDNAVAGLTAQSERVSTRIGGYRATQAVIRLLRVRPRSLYALARELYGEVHDRDLIGVLIDGQTAGYIACVGGRWRLNLDAAPACAVRAA